MSLIMDACAPLTPRQRDEFLKRVASSLADYDPAAPCTIHRVIVGVQRPFFQPPDLSRDRDGSRWRR
jgi:hypothetical protein